MAKIKHIGILFLVLFSVGIVVAGEEYISWPIIGIDLGATYSRVGIYRSNKVEIIANDEGNRHTPSWVSFSDSEHLIGQAAQNQAPFNAERTIFDVKRLLGKRFDDPEVQRDMKKLPYKIVNKEGKPCIEIKTKDDEVRIYSPEEISAMVLRKMKETAESYLGVKVKNAIVTVPGYFDMKQSTATEDAANIAGLNVVRMVNEPSSAAVAYGLDKGEPKNILVFNLGGGTLDVSILTMDNGVFELLVTSRDPHLGGEDFDHRIMNYFIKLIKKKYNKDISSDDNALRKLKKECERAKRALSSQHQVKVEIDSLLDGVDFSEPLTREIFEELNIDLYKKTMVPVKNAMEDSYLRKSEIDEILLVGGSSRIPKVQEILKDYFDGKEAKIDINPDEVVAYGATLLAHKHFMDNQKPEFLWSWKDLSTLSLGLETVGGVMTTLIPRHGFIPNKKSRVFTTYQDQQTSISIKVYQGERIFTKDCRELGGFNLSGITPAASGVAQIEVTFELDENMNLYVKAEDKVGKKSESIMIHASKIYMSPEEIDRRMMEYYDADEKLVEKIGALDHSDKLAAISCSDEK